MSCSICRCEYNAFTSVYAEDAWIDGRRHAIICDVCMMVPKTYDYDEKKQEVVVYDELDPKRLNTVEEMMSDGCDKDEARRSIKAVKAILKKRKK